MSSKKIIHEIVRKNCKSLTTCGQVKDRTRRPTAAPGSGSGLTCISHHHEPYRSQKYIIKLLMKVYVPMFHLFTLAPMTEKHKHVGKKG